MHWRHDWFDVVAYDPPYVSIGGRNTTNLGDYHKRYGIDTAPMTPGGVQYLINDGLKECARVTKYNGILLVKCQDYISSGKLWPGTYLTARAADCYRLTLVDRFEHIAKSPRPQPSGRKQVHARRNLSTLFVFRKKGVRDADLVDSTLVRGVRSRIQAHAR
jgi:hypothetical protein